MASFTDDFESGLVTWDAHVGVYSLSSLGHTSGTRALGIIAESSVNHYIQKTVGISLPVADGTWVYTAFALYIPDWDLLWDGGAEYTPNVLSFSDTPSPFTVNFYLDPTSSTTGVIQFNFGGGGGGLKSSDPVPHGQWVSVEIARRSRSGPDGMDLQFWIDNVSTGGVQSGTTYNQQTSVVDVGDNGNGPPTTSAPYFVDDFSYSDVARVGPVDLTGAYYPTTPSNDDFVNRITLGTSLPGTRSAGDTTAVATQEGGEVGEWDASGYPSYTDQSVWYEFTPLVTARYRFAMVSLVDRNVYGVLNNPALALYSGAAVGSLTRLDSNLFDSDVSAVGVRANLTSGVTYKLKAFALQQNGALPDFYTFDFDLEWDTLPALGSPPANDDVANADDLGTNPNTVVSGSTYSATRESPLEDVYIGGVSVWYRFHSTLTTDIHVKVEKTGTDPDWRPYVEVYEIVNDPPADLYAEAIGVGYAYDGVATTVETDVPVEAGKDYLIYVGSSGDNSGDDFDLTVSPAPQDLALPFIASTTQLYGMLLNTLEVPFISSTTALFALSLNHIDVLPFIPSGTSLFTPTLRSSSIAVPFISNTLVFPMRLIRLSSNNTLPTISGIPQQGNTLTASPGTWAGTSPHTFAYQWERCDAVGANCVDIVGAYLQTYTVQYADVGSTLRVRVSSFVNTQSTVVSELEDEWALLLISPEIIAWEASEPTEWADIQAYRMGGAVPTVTSDEGLALKALTTAWRLATA